MFYRSKLSPWIPTRIKFERWESDQNWQKLQLCGRYFRKYVRINGEIEFTSKRRSPKTTRHTGPLPCGLKQIFWGSVRQKIFRLLLLQKIFTKTGRFRYKSFYIAEDGTETHFTHRSLWAAEFGETWGRTPIQGGPRYKWSITILLHFNFF